MLHPGRNFFLKKTTFTFPPHKPWHMPWTSAAFISTKCTSPSSIKMVPGNPFKKIILYLVWFWYTCPWYRHNEIPVNADWVHVEWRQLSCVIYSIQTSIHQVSICNEDYSLPTENRSDCCQSFDSLLSSLMRISVSSESSVDFFVWFCVVNNISLYMFIHKDFDQDYYLYLWFFHLHWAFYS